MKKNQFLFKLFTPYFNRKCRLVVKQFDISLHGLVWYLLGPLLEKHVRLWPSVYRYFPSSQTGMVNTCTCCHLCSALKLIFEAIGANSTALTAITALNWCRALLIDFWVVLIKWRRSRLWLICLTKSFCELLRRHSQCHGRLQWSLWENK